MRSITGWMGMIALLALPVCGASYYLDNQNGNDDQDGTAAERAWKTLDRANRAVFQAGDRILFKAGEQWSGQFKPQGSGQSSDGKILPITVGKYGTGPLPRLNGEGKVLDTLLVRNVEFWEIADLEITNLGDERVPWRTGVRVVADGFGKMRHIHLRNLYVHDVNGDLRKSREGCGIYFESRGSNRSHLDGFRVENCRVVRADRNGICQRTSNGSRSLNVVIRENLLEDIGGDCIKTWGANGALIEHNVVRGGRTRCNDAAAGIWPFDCDDTVIQFNEVSGLKGTKDGQGFDSDYRCRNSLFQYNYSHDNEGGFFLICGPGNSYNTGTVIRYNISQNDGDNSARVFHFGGGSSRTRIYNNTIYVGPKQNLPLLLFTEWSGGNANDTWFGNNLFYVDGQVRYDWGKSRNNVFESNLFYGKHGEIPNGPDNRVTQPPLAAPGAGGDGFDSLKAYRPTAKSPAILGKVIPDNGGRDFFGKPLPRDQPPCIGALEY